MPAANTNGIPRTGPAQPSRARTTKLESDNLTHKDTIRNLQHELQKYKDICEELIANQAFLSKTDVLFISDIKDKVNALNQEIFQASAAPRYSLMHRKYELAKEEMEAAFADVCKTVSEPLARVFVRKGQKPGLSVVDPRPMLVQVVLGMYLVHFCSSKLDSWLPGTQGTSDFISARYSDIRRNEELGTISGMASEQALTLVQKAIWRDEFMMGLDNIFRVAKWGIETQEDFIAFKRKLFPIFDAVGDLKLALGKKTTSIDLEVNITCPGVPFDYQWMQDVYGEGLRANSEVVAGMTGIGLKKIVRLQSGDEMFESVLAPEVILVSTLQQEGLYPWDDEGQGMSSPSKPPPPLKQVITMTNKILFDNRSHSPGLTKNPQKIATDNEKELLSATRAILDGIGAAPMITVINRVLELRKEIDKISNFLAENIRHTSNELFQQELDQFFQDSKRVVGTRLSKFLRKHSEEEELSKSLIEITTQICMVSFCASEWERYLNPKLRAETNRITAQNQNKRKAAFLSNLISVFKTAAWAIPGAANRAAFEESLNPFFKSMEETETALKKVPEFTKVSLSFVSPGEDLAGSKTYAEDATKDGIQLAKPSHNIVLGTAAFGVRCVFQDRIKGVDEEKPRTLLTAKVVLESKLQHIFGAQKKGSPKTRSG